MTFRVIARAGPAEGRRAGNYPVRECTDAFKSQVADPEVREEFLRRVYPTLSDSQKDLANGLLQ